MGKKSSPPPGPDYSKLLELTDKYAAKNVELMEEYLAFQKESFGAQQEMTDKIAAIQLPAMQAEAKMAEMQRQRYLDMGIPAENAYVERLQGWDTPERREERAGQEQAAQAMATEAARVAAQQELIGRGIDPSQVISAAMDHKIRLASAVSRAAAGNAGRQAIEREGLQMEGEARNILAGLPAQSAAALGTATGAGQTALGNLGALNAYGTSGYMNAQNMNQQGSQMTNQGWQVANSVYGNQLKATELQNQQAMATWNAIGGIAGATMGAAGGAGGFSNLFGAEGGEAEQMAGSRMSENPLAAGEAIPSQEPGQQQYLFSQPPVSTAPVAMVPQNVAQMAEGGDAQAAVPRPPSQGIPQDNIPAMLSAGEQVVASDVAKWKGEEFFAKLANDSRKARASYEQQRDQNQMNMGIPLAG